MSEYHSLGLWYFFIIQPELQNAYLVDKLVDVDEIIQEVVEICVKVVEIIKKVVEIIVNVDEII